MAHLINQFENTQSSIESLKNELYLNKDFFIENSFIITDESAERMANFIHYIKNKITV